MCNKNIIRSCNDNPSLNLICLFQWPRSRASTFSDPNNNILGSLNQKLGSHSLDGKLTSFKLETWIQSARQLTVSKPALHVINVAEGKGVLVLLPWPPESLELTKSSWKSSVCWVLSLERTVHKCGQSGRHCSDLLRWIIHLIFTDTLGDKCYGDPFHR